MAFEDVLKAILWTGMYVTNISVSQTTTTIASVGRGGVQKVWDNMDNIKVLEKKKKMLGYTELKTKTKQNKNKSTKPDPHFLC